MVEIEHDAIAEPGDDDHQRQRRKTKATRIQSKGRVVASLACWDEVRTLRSILRRWDNGMVPLDAHPSNQS